MQNGFGPSPSLPARALHRQAARAAFDELLEQAGIAAAGADAPRAAPASDGAGRLDDPETKF